MGIRKKENRNRFKLECARMEWAILDEMAKKEGCKDFRTYLNVQLHKISAKRTEINCKECYCNKKSSLFEIPAHLELELINITEEHCCTLGGFAKKFIINPLLVKYYHEKGF